MATAIYSAAGIVGNATSNSIVRYCFNKGDVSCNLRYVRWYNDGTQASVSGISKGGTPYSCYNTGIISGCSYWSGSYASITSTGGCDNCFSNDMDMPSPKGTKADYFNTGFDRGHLCPAGDNKWSQKAMDECFLMTNMCPQTHALNAGVWNSIEQQCRTWAKKYGKVYIVCGPIFLNKQHRKLGKNKVVVPDAFFKVILRTGKNPQAIGFICRNQSAKGLQKKDFVNSIDEVERITGYDFFSKLPDNVEKKIEAKADLSNW